MMRTLRQPATAAWLFLVTATGVSGWLAETHRGVSWAATLIALIAAVKIDVIMQYFMELKVAPPLWRWLMRAWLVVATCIVAFGVSALRSL